MSHFQRSARLALLAAVGAVACLGTCVRTASAVPLNPGDIVITADLGPIAGVGENYGLMRVDPVTGDRTIISDATHGAGPAMDLSLPGIEREPDGRLLVGALNGIFYVDPATGDRTQLSDISAAGVVTVAGQIYAVSGGGALYRVDPTTGAATALAQTHDAAAITFAAGKLIIATGPYGFSSYSIGGTFAGLYQVGTPVSVIPYTNGTLMYGNIGSGISASGVYTFDPTLPDPYNNTTFSSAANVGGTPPRGTGAGLNWAAGLGVGPSGTVYVANFTTLPSGSILAIDPATGNRSIFSDATHGLGPTFLQPTGLVVVPEPGTLLLVVLGAAALFLRRILRHVPRTRASLAALTAFLGLFVVATRAQAVALNPGDIVITADLGPIAGGGENYGLMRIDPVTGDRTIISDATHGAGPAMDLSLPGIARVPDGRLLVGAGNGIFYVDPATGDRTMLSAVHASGVVEVGNQIYAAGSTGLYRVDPVTGDSTFLASTPGNTAALAFADGKLFVGAALESFSAYSIGGAYLGPYQVRAPGSVIPYTNGTLMYGDIGSAISASGVFTFDPKLPSPYDNTTFSSAASIAGMPPRGTGAILNWASGLGVGESGTVFVANLTLSGSGSILAIDPATGNRSIFSNATHGLGPTFLQPTGLVVVPEPATILLAALGIVMAIGRRFRSTKRLLGIALVATLLAVLTVPVRADDFQSLYSFAGGAGGTNPNTHLTSIGGTLYGTTQTGGPVDEGTIFSLADDGSQFRTMYSFGALPGSTPHAGLTAVGSTLYGTTYYGVGDGRVGYGYGFGYGTVFSIAADGSNFQNVHNMDYDFADQGGLNPNSLLAVVGSDLYGRTAQHYVSGQYNYGPGTVYSLSPTGSNYQTVYTLSNVSAATDIAALGSSLYAAISDLTIVGSHIYGTSATGGAYGYGDIFSMNLDGTNQQTLYSFTGTGPDGADPGQGLTLVGTRLYGTTVYGGPALEYGNVFSIDLNGANFRLEHSFINSDGAYPQGGMTLVGNALYGTTSAGGANDAGTVFSLNVSASVVPEPATWLLAVCGVALAGVARRRQVLAGSVWRGSQLATFVILFLVIASSAGSFTAGASTLGSGDIVAFETGNNTLYRIDPQAGVRTILADANHGTGPAFGEVSGLTTDAAGDIFIAVAGSSPFSLGTILRVDAATGNRTLFATLSTPIATLAMSNDGNLLAGEGTVLSQITGGSGGSDIRTLDPATGATLSILALSTMNGVNSVPLGGLFTSLAEDPSGNFFGILNNGQSRIFSINPTTGLGAALPINGNTTQLTSLTVDTAGRVIYGDSYYQHSGFIERFDPTTSTNTVLSAANFNGQMFGTGPAFLIGGTTSIDTLTMAADGSLLATGDNGMPSIFRVDPLTGNRTIFSQVFAQLPGNFYLSVVPAPSTSQLIPEPASIIPAAIAGLGLFGVAQTRRRRGGSSIRKRGEGAKGFAVLASLTMVFAAAGTSHAAKLVVMSTDTTSVPGAKVFTVGVEVTLADVSQGGTTINTGTNVYLNVQNITFLGGPTGPVQQTGAANRADIQSIQSGFIDNAAFDNAGPATNAALGANGVKALYQDSWWYSSGTGTLTGAVDSAGNSGVVTTNPAGDGSGVYTLGPTTNVGPTGYLFRPTGNTILNPTTGQTMSFSGIYGQMGANYFDQAPLANLFVHGVLDIPLAQIVATGNIDIASPPDAYIALPNHFYNVMGGNYLVDPHAHLDYALQQIVVPEPATILLGAVGLCLAGISRRRVRHSMRLP